MKFSLFAIVAGIASLVSAQAGSAEPPKCGMNIMISAISSSGCGITEMQCMCKNTKLIKKMQDEIPKACKAPADQAVFALFFNAQCVGQAGFPISMGAVNKNGTVSSSSAAGAKSDARTTRVSVGVLAVAGGLALALS